MAAGKEWTRKREVCTRCPQPGVHVLLDGDGGHVFCDLCVIQLLADVQRAGTHLVFSVESALVTT